MNLKSPAGENSRDKEEIGDVNQHWTDLDWSVVSVMGCSVVLYTNHESKPVAEFPPGVQGRKVSHMLQLLITYCSLEKYMI